MLSSNKENVNNTNGQVTTPDLKCEKHQREFECFCIKCEMVICPSCLMFGVHKDHTVCSFEEASQKLSKLFNDARNLGYLKVKVFKDKKISTDHTLLQTISKKTQIIKEIKTTFRLMREKFSKRENILINQIEKAFKDVEHNLRKNSEITRTKIDKIEKICDVFENYKQTSNQKILVNETEIIKRNISEIKKTDHKQSAFIPEELI